MPQLGVQESRGAEDTEQDLTPFRLFWGSPEHSLSGIQLIARLGLIAVGHNDCKLAHDEAYL